ncbi:MAG: hypothetical protein J0L57_12355 [Burkholderiales bacterium]|nr:hypothetical protein [Burkholderiales bacterium]
MQSFYARAFEREMGCTEAEWLSWLPRAVHGHALDLGSGRATVTIGEGRLQLDWQVLPPRQIALARLPRLAARFDFDDRVSEDARQAFMRTFDLYMQRGGG